MRKKHFRKYGIIEYAKSRHISPLIKGLNNKYLKKTI